MTIDETKELFNYGSWANALMLGAAEGHIPPSTDFTRYLREAK